MDEIKEYSIFSYRCGVLQNTIAAWVPLGVGICRLAPGLWFIPLAIVFTLISIVAAQKRFYFTEIVYLAEPTEFEYEVAIKAMTEAIARKELVEKCLSDLPEMHESGVSIAIRVIEDENGNKMPMFCIQIKDPSDSEDE